MEAITVQKTSKYYITEFEIEEGFLNEACNSISNLPDNTASQTQKVDLRPEARGQGRSPHLPPSNAGCGLNALSAVQNANGCVLRTFSY
jgi:hypothetical protein